MGEEEAALPGFITHSSRVLCSVSPLPCRGTVTQAISVLNWYVPPDQSCSGWFLTALQTRLQMTAESTRPEAHSTASQPLHAGLPAALPVVRGPESPHTASLFSFFPLTAPRTLEQHGPHGVYLTLTRVPKSIQSLVLYKEFTTHVHV